MADKSLAAVGPLLDLIRALARGGRNRTALGTLVFAATMALAPSAVAADGDVRIIDLHRSGDPFAWIDNETVLLLELTGETASRRGRSHHLSRLVSLNYRSGEQKVYGPADGQPCYADGYVSYFRVDRSSGALLAVYGELGKETTRPVQVKRGEQIFDYGSCRPLFDMPKRPGWLDEKTQVRYLSPPAGIIDCRTDRVTSFEEYVKARFHKPRDATGVALPFSCFRTDPGLRYYPFKKAYFAYERGGPWPQNHERRAYWLYPDGKVETIVLPYSEAIRGKAAVPTARGIVAFPGQRTYRRDYPTYAVYLVTPDTAKVIAKGNLLGAATSPDGCKVAMLHDPEYGGRVDEQDVIAGATLKIVELCEAK
jgi:hypothetical protein